MGAVQVTYKKSRGADEQGAEINDGNKFFKEICGDLATYQAMFDQLEPDNQQKLTDVFEGEVDFSSQTGLAMWLGENEDE